MAWLKVDTGFARHRKVGRLTYQERWQHLEAMCWCAEMGTDGAISEADLSVIWPGIKRTSALRLAARFVDGGVWDEKPDGWEIHDWSVYNISAENAKEKRDREAERKREWRERKRKKPTNVPPDATRDKTRDVTPAATRTSPSRGRPDPTRPPLSGGGEGSSAETSAGPQPQPPPDDQDRQRLVDANGGEPVKLGRQVLMESVKSPALRSAIGQGGES